MPQITDCRVYTVGIGGPELVMEADEGNYKESPPVVHISLRHPRVEGNGPDQSGRYRITCAEADFQGEARFQCFAPDWGLEEERGAALFVLE